MFSKKLIKKIQTTPKLRELDKALHIFMESEGFTRVSDGGGGLKIVKVPVRRANKVNMGIKLKRIKAY